MKPSNSVYTGQLKIAVGGTESKHIAPMNGLEGYAEQMFGQWYFQPEVRPIPETNEEIEVTRLVSKGVELTVSESMLWERMIDSVTYRVSADNLYHLCPKQS